MKMAEKEVQNEQGYEHEVNEDFREPEVSASRDDVLTNNGLRLHPQPTADPLDPLDPLNWTNTRKHTLLAIVMVKYFLFTYLTSTTVPSFSNLQEQYNISYAQVNWTVAIPALGLAVGPLLWSAFADIYGRRLIFILGTSMAFGATIGAAKAPGYSGYMAARFFQGIGVSPAATVGLAIINDLFYEHERGQKVGLWVLAIDTGLLVGPILGGFVNLVSSAWIQWLTAIFFGVLLLLELALMPETLYPRSDMLRRAPITQADTKEPTEVKNILDQGSETLLSAPTRTRTLAFINFKPIPGMRHPKPWDSLIRFTLIFKFPVVALSVLIFCFTWYWWILSVVTMIPAAYPNYRPQIQGLLFIGLLVGTIFSELVVGGRLSDLIVLRLARRSEHGARLPEMRLWLAYPAGLCTAVELVVWGISIDRQYHWMVGQVAFFLVAVGIQVGNTTVCSYIVDAYPLQSMSVITFYSVFLNLSAFVDPFFIASWQQSLGWTWCFALQAIITLFGGLPIIALLHWFGPALRRVSGNPSWVNPEFDSFGL